MNIYQRFNLILNRKQTGVAQITGSLGGGSWNARTQGGNTIVLTGVGSIGKHVFYDITTRQIESDAPDLDVTDISV